MRVIRDRKARTLELDQEQYLQKVLHKFGFPKEKARPITTPIDSYTNLRPANSTDKRIDATWYREVVGSLMYAITHTHPDIAFALGRLSQYMQDPAEHHEREIKRLMRYLRCTIKFRIRFSSSDRLEVYSDADYASDRTDRKSISAQVGLIGSGPVFWGSRKQTSVSTATTEAEYIAMSSTAKQGQWLAQLLRDMGFPEYVAMNGTTVQTFGDNQGAFALAHNSQLTERSKHIDVSYHHIRDLQEYEKVEIKYVPTEKMAADGFTKPLIGDKFDRFRKQIGMVKGLFGTGDKNSK